MKSLNKIRVLLIDDNPEGLIRYVTVSGKELPLPKLGPSGVAKHEIDSIEDLFEIRWLPTSGEAREYRDLSKALSLIDPAALGSEGWVPEILIFDYSLSHDRKTVVERLQAAGVQSAESASEWAGILSPLASLRNCAASRKLMIPTPPPPPPTGALKEWDNEGCFCGGLILTLFWAHPCSPLPLTRKGKDKTVETEAGFFEWLLEEDGGGTFAQKGKPGSNWHDLLTEAVPGLRHRIQQLLQGRVIEVALDHLLALAGPEGHDVLEIRSRYAVRRLPVAGLFADVPIEIRIDAVNDWARYALAIMFSDLLGSAGNISATGDLTRRLDPALADFRSGMQLAERLWQAYNSALVGQRYRLSELAVLAEDRVLDGEERRELEQLCATFNVDPERLNAKATRCQKNTHDLRSVEGGRIRRWGALMVMVRLEMQVAAARKAWREFCRSRNIHNSFDPLIQILRQEDVYLALFPVPSHPLKTPFECGEDPRIGWGHVLRDLSSGGHKNDLKLDVKEVLAGEGWWQSGDGGCKPCGLHPGERYTLRIYARTHDGVEEEWPGQVAWLSEPVEMGAQATVGGNGH